MASSASKTFAAVLALFLAWASVVEAAPSTEQIARWIENLSDSRFAVREAASKELWTAGRAAEPALKEALRSQDAEVVLRVRAILDKFKWGIYPDTPPQVLNLIGQYRSGTPVSKQAAIQDLLKLGRHGIAVVTKIAEAENNENDRRTLFQFVAQEASRAAGILLAQDEHDALEKLLEECLVSDVELAHNNYAVYLMLRGRLDAKLPEWRARAEKDNGAKAAETLTYLYRLKGDIPNAVWAAEKSGKPNLGELILAERSDWKTVAGKSVSAIDTRPLKTMGLRAFYHRMAGNKEEFEKASAEIRKHGEAQADGSADLRLAAEVLLLVDQPQAAFELLTAKGQGFVLTFELLCSQMKLKEALALAEKATASPDRIAMQARRGRVLYHLGEKEKALKLLAALGEEIKTPPARNTYIYDRSPECDLVKVELQLGLRDAALEHFAYLLNRSSTQPALPRLWEIVFPRDHATAQVWWKLLRQNQGTQPAAAMRSVNELIHGKVADKDLATLIEQTDQATGNLEAVEKESALQAIAYACQAAGKDQQARAYLDRSVAVSNSVSALTHLGDFLAEKKRPKEAAETYRQAWEKDPGAALPLYLAGSVLSQSGSAREGKKLMEQASWLVLGNEIARYNLADELAKRDLDDQALRERELLSRIGWRRNVYVGNTVIRLSPALETSKDYYRAANCTQEQALVIMRSNIYFTEPSGYIGVPQRVHRQRARGLIAEGKIDEALEEARQAEALITGNLTLVTNLVPELEKRDRKKEADQLYNNVRSIHEEVLKEYPNSPWSHNSLAWLDVGCKRPLGEALEHARKAVELDPEKASYLDTLAEVHFQRGDKEKAIELIKKCIALEPKSERHPKQLKRFETGDPSVDIP